MELTFLILLLLALGTLAYAYKDVLFDVDTIDDAPPYQPARSSLLKHNRLSPDVQKRLATILDKNGFFPRNALDPRYRQILEKLEGGQWLEPSEAIELSRYNPRLSGLNKDLDEYCILNFGGRRPHEVIRQMQQLARGEDNDDENTKKARAFLERFFIAW